MKLNKVDESIIKVLKAEGKELTLQELAEKTGETEKKIFRSLKKFFEHGMVDTKARKYTLLMDKPPTGKEDESESSEEE
jgi:DNA-binding IclR family transcriptional regulator